MDKATADMIANGDLAEVLAGIVADEHAEFATPDDGLVSLVLCGRSVITFNATRIDLHSHGTDAAARECFRSHEASAQAYLSATKNASAADMDMAGQLASQVMAGELTLPQAIEAFQLARQASNQPVDRTGMYL
jgi:hypothetical protein